MNKKEILLAVSGGIDSAVSIHLLQQSGFKVHGVYFEFWHWENETVSDKHHILQLISRILKVEIETLDYRESFRKSIIQSFITEQKNGLTPNPCVRCNPTVKFRLLQELADKRGVHHISTGHYARVKHDMINEHHLLKTGVDADKDQSYVLCYLDQSILSRVVFPMGELIKKEVYEIGKNLNLPLQKNSESQDLCFVKPENYTLFLKEVLGKPKKGEIVNSSGQVIGTHDGLQFYTIGQRKRIRVSNKEAFYVLRKDINSNKLIVGMQKELDNPEFFIHHINWIPQKPKMPFTSDVKIRYRSKRFRCRVDEKENDIYKISCETSPRGVTPGQYAVFYEGDYVIGGGKILG